MSQGWVDWNINRYTRDVICRGNYCGLTALKDGIVIQKFGNIMPGANTRRERFINEHSARTYKQEVHPTYVAPGDEVVRQWTAMKNAIAYCTARRRTDLDYIAQVTKRFARGELLTRD